ncbi:MAG: hypothetical protein ABIJ26_00415 [Candidatus Margulisiibacteriota bacterium]
MRPEEVKNGQKAISYVPSQQLFAQAKPEESYSDYSFFESGQQIQRYLLEKDAYGQVLRGEAAIIQSLQKKIDSFKKAGKTLVIQVGHIESSAEPTFFISRLVRGLKNLDYVMLEAIPRTNEVGLMMDEFMENISPRYNPQKRYSFDAPGAINTFLETGDTKQLDLLEQFLENISREGRNSKDIIQSFIEIVRAVRAGGCKFLPGDMPLAELSATMPGSSSSSAFERWHDIREKYMVEILRKNVPQGKTVLMLTGASHLDRVRGVAGYFKKAFGGRGSIFGVYLSGGDIYEGHQIDRVVEELGRFDRKWAGESFAVPLPDKLVQADLLIELLPFKRTIKGEKGLFSLPLLFGTGGY